MRRLQTRRQLLEQKQQRPSQSQPHENALQALLASCNTAVPPGNKGRMCTHHHTVARLQFPSYCRGYGSILIEQ